ncbi:hypothetical protein Tco_1214558 [Tanacetum coccineum]
MLKILSPKLGAFQRLLRKCPHHGFSLMHQLDTFYNSLSYNDQDSLNSAAGGNFLYKSPTEGLQIIENKAKVRCSRNAVMRVSTNAPPSSNSSSNFEFQQMAAALEDKMTLTFRNEMNEMKNMMKALVPTPVPIKAVEERCTTCGSNHSFNVCPMTRGGYESPVYHDNFQQFQQTASVGNFVQNGNSGKPSNQGNIPHQGMVPYQSPPQNSQIMLASQLDIFKKTTEGSMQVMRNHITNLKAEIRSEVQATLQNQINSLKGEFKNELKSQHNLFMNQQNDFQNNLQNMLSGFFQNQSQPSTSTSMVPTTLPSNTITNPRCEARAITTRSGLSYTPVPPIPPPLYDENEPLTEKETEVTKDKVLPSTQDIQPPVIQKSHDPVKPVSSPISPEPSSAQVDNSPLSKEPSKKTRLPYPSRKKDDFPSRNDESILKEEVHEEALKSYLNPLFEDDEEIISIEASSKISPKVDVKAIMTFFAPIGNFARKWATSEVEKDNVEINQEIFKSDNKNDLGIHDDKEEEIAFLDGLLEDENFFETNDKKVEFLERKTKEDFETKVEIKSKKELQVFHPDIETLNHIETTSYVGSDYVFYEDFNLVDMIFPMDIQGKIFDPGITFSTGNILKRNAFKDKVQKRLSTI